MVDGRGAYRLEPRGGIASQLGSLGEDFRLESLSTCFDMDAIERHCDPAGSHIAYFDPETGAVSLLWGDAEPGLYVQDEN